MSSEEQNKNSKYLIYLLIILAAAAVIYAFSGFINPLPLSSNTQKSQFSTITTGTTDADDVEISLTPFFQNGKLIVASAFNTHSVYLDQLDLTELVSLKYNGRTIQPTKAFSLTGHHGLGQIVFNSEEEFDSFMIIIKGIPLTLERKYAWG